VPVDLAPGESYTATFDTVLKDTVKSDTIRLCADSYDVVDEIDEANNCLEYVWPPTPTSRPKQPEKIKQKRAE
jgi:subtilase family serine protease